MPSRSFKEYIKHSLDNKLWQALEEYLEEIDSSTLDLRLNKVRNIGELGLYDTEIQFVDVSDLPGTKIEFDVILDATLIVHDGDRYHNDETEAKHQWFMLRCRGDLEDQLESTEIEDVSVYFSRNRQQRPMSDSLVPIIYKENLEKEAEKFLKKHFPKALLQPMWLDPKELAENMGLTVLKHSISEDESVFGQIYFCDSSAELYNAESGTCEELPVSAGTVVVDPTVFFQRNIGAYNNTIIHECIHWDLHKKAFALEQLFDVSASKIGCRVEGGVYGNKREAVDWMEWQANALTPKVQMPMEMFRKRVNALISQYRAKLHEYDMIDIIEPVIDQLVLDFGASRAAVKIRMLDAGFDEAIGAFTYIDGRYVKPHKAKHGFLKENQTFSISCQDAAILAKTSPELQKVLEKGRYIYVDSHYVLNLPLYVETDMWGETVLTHYARNHMDECCLVFDLTIIPKIGERYHSVCFLNRDKTSTVDFNVTFHDGYENAPHDRQMKKLEEIFEEEAAMYGQLTADYRESLKKVIEWRGVTYKEIGERAGINQETVSRCVNGTRVSLNTLILICLALHLPYKISKKIIDDSPESLSFANKNHQWYEFVLEHLYPKKVAEVKAFLNERGVDPL